MINKRKLIEVLINVSKENVIHFSMNRSRYKLYYEIKKKKNKLFSSPYLSIYIENNSQQKFIDVTFTSNNIIEFLEVNLNNEEDITDIQKLILGLM